MDFVSNHLPPISVENFSPAPHGNSSTADWRVHDRLTCIFRHLSRTYLPCPCMKMHNPSVKDKRSEKAPDRFGSRST